MPTASELESMLLRYAGGEIDDDRFHEWFARASVEGFGDRHDQALADTVEGLIAESSHAGWSVADLREELANTIRRFENTVVEAETQLQPVALSDSGWGSHSASSMISGTFPLAAKRPVIQSRFRTVVLKEQISLAG